MKDIIWITKALQKQGFSCYLVGGCVRDYIRKEEPHDYDFCTNAKPDEIIRVLKENHIPYHAEGIDYGTVVANINGTDYEITTYRKEQSYSDGRHPDSVIFADDIKEDLSRRDFTVNAIAYDIKTKQFVDPFSGISDIRQGVLRCVGEADARIQEDGLRILRALRFAIKYDMKMDDSLKSAIHHNISMLDKVSKERITEELRKILTCNRPVTSVFQEFSDVIVHIMPELVKTVGFGQNNKYHKHDVYEHILAVVDNCQTNTFEIKLAALLHDIGKPDTCTLGEDGCNHFYGHAKESVKISRQVFQNDLVLTRTERERVLELIEAHDNHVASTEKSVKRFLAKHGLDFMYNWMILRQADMDDHIYPDKKNPNFYTDIPKITEILSVLKDKENCFSVKDLAINGNDLMKEFDIPPSPLIGQILNQLLDAVLDEEVANEKQDLLCMAEDVMNEKENEDYER
jgi:tRNA nucleotidyltransferase (CCA-adding enzyme)